MKPRPAWLRLGAASALTAGLATLLAFDVRFHPNQGEYFNALVGGPRGAFARYDMDYWGNCILQAVEWSAATARAHGTTIVIAGDPHHIVQFNAARFREVEFSRESLNRHHVHVRLVRGRVAAQGVRCARPALHQVRTPGGAVLCTLTAGPAFAELQARGHPAASPPSNRPAGGR